MRAPKHEFARLSQRCTKENTAIGQYIAGSLHLEPLRPSNQLCKQLAASVQVGKQEAGKKF